MTHLKHALKSELRKFCSLLRFESRISKFLVTEFKFNFGPPIVHQFMIGDPHLRNVCRIIYLGNDFSQFSKIYPLLDEFYFTVDGLKIPLSR